MTPDDARATSTAAGAAGAAVALGVTALADGASTSVPSLVLAVGQAVIRAAPGAAARAGIDAVGTADKPLVVTGTVVLALAFGAGLGRLAVRRATALPVGFAAFAAVGVAAVEDVEAGSTTGAIAAAAVAAASGVWVARLLLRLRERPPRLTPTMGVADSGRRWFLGATGGAFAGAAILTGLGARLADTATALAQRAGIRLPAPRSRAQPAPAELAAADGLTPWVTANDRFYRIDEALVVPSVDVESWRLRVVGMVDRPLELTLDDLLGRPLAERWVTLACVSNEVGGDLVGNARWLGVPLRSLLDEAGVQDGADQIVGRSVDAFTAGFPLDVALDGRDALVAVGMNGEPLPARHGFPARLVVPGLYGYVSATKWLAEIELTTFADFDAYWVRRGWADRAPVLLQSRIDRPRRGADLAAGAQVVAGVAWAPNRGIGAVEVRIDEEPWRPADLQAGAPADSWAQWRAEWDAEVGEHVIAVRATAADGEVQTERPAPPFPSGATGWHRVVVTVA